MFASHPSLGLIVGTKELSDLQNVPLEGLAPWSFGSFLRQALWVPTESLLFCCWANSKGALVSIVILNFLGYIINLHQKSWTSFHIAMIHHDSTYVSFKPIHLESSNKSICFATFTSIESIANTKSNPNADNPPKVAHRDSTGSSKKYAKLRSHRPHLLHSKAS